MFVYPLAFNTCSEATDMDYFISIGLSVAAYVKSEIELGKIWGFAGKLWIFRKWSIEDWHIRYCYNIAAICNNKLSSKWLMLCKVGIHRLPVFWNIDSFEINLSENYDYLENPQIPSQHFQPSCKRPRQRCWKRYKTFRWLKQNRTQEEKSSIFVASEQRLDVSA